MINIRHVTSWDFIHRNQCEAHRLYDICITLQLREMWIATREWPLFARRNLKLSRAKKTPSVSSREATLIALAAFDWPGTNVTSEKPQCAPLAHPYCSLLLYTRKITLTYVRTYVRFAWADKVSRAIAPVRSQPYERILKLSCVHYTYVRGAVSVLRASERSTHPRNSMRHAEWK